VTSPGTRAQAVAKIGGILREKLVNIFTTATAFEVVKMLTPGRASTHRLTARG
jgi:hypothetical protein